MGEKNENVIGSAKGGHKANEDPIAYLDVRIPTGGIAAQCMIPLRNDVGSFQKNTCVSIAGGWVTEKANAKGELVTSVKQGIIPAFAIVSKDMNSRDVALS